MKTIEMIWWIVYTVAILIGAVVSLRFMLININLYRADIDGRIKHHMSKGKERTEAIDIVTQRRKNEFLKAIGHGAIIFVFVYIAIDILFRHIIGG